MISGLHHYALEVPDLAVAEGFLQDFGLETGEKDGSLVAMCPGRQQEQVRLVEAPAKRLHHVTFTLRPGTTDAVREALERSGTPVIEPPPGATEDGLWLRDPDGTAVQLLDEPPAPARPAAEVLVNMGGTRQRFDVAQWRTATEDVLPRRLGHSPSCHAPTVAPQCDIPRPADQVAASRFEQVREALPGAPGTQQHLLHMIFGPDHRTRASGSSARAARAGTGGPRPPAGSSVRGPKSFPVRRVRIDDNPPLR